MNKKYKYDENVVKKQLKSANSLSNAFINKILKSNEIKEFKLERINNRPFIYVKTNDVMSITTYAFKKIGKTYIKGTVDCYAVTTDLLKEYDIENTSIKGLTKYYLDKFYTNSYNSCCSYYFNNDVIKFNNVEEIRFLFIKEFLRIIRNQIIDGRKIKRLFIRKAGFENVEIYIKTSTEEYFRVYIYDLESIRIDKTIKSREGVLSTEYNILSRNFNLSQFIINDSILKSIIEKESNKFTKEFLKLLQKK